MRDDRQRLTDILTAIDRIIAKTGEGRGAFDILDSRRRVEIFAAAVKRFRLFASLS